MAGTELTLDRADGEVVAVYAVGGEAAGSLLVDGAATLTWGETDGAMPQTRSFRVDVPERMTFSAARPRGVPARVVLEPEGPLALRDIAVSDVRFGREVVPIPGEATFVSTIRAGQLRVPDVGESYELSFGSSVILRDLKGYVRQLRVENRDGDEDTIAVDFEGTVERVAVGPRGRERDVTPSVLAYLYHNQQLAFLFAAASFVWGTLWASASATSCLLVLTYGFTYCAGMSRTSWPSLVSSRAQVVRPASRLQPDPTGRQVGEELEHLAAPQLPCRSRRRRESESCSLRCRGR